MSRLALAVALSLVACSGPRQSATYRAVEADLDAEVRRAYLAEDAEALRRSMTGLLLGPGYRRALELSSLLRDGDCRVVELETVIEQTPNWVAYLEHADCVARQNRGRDALESYVRSVDLASDAAEIDYILLRVCRTADATALPIIDEMCVGEATR